MSTIDVTLVTLLGLLAVGFLGVVVTLLGNRAVHRTLSSRASPIDVTARAGPKWAVTVLKPVKGLDEGLEENLLSLMRQDWPDLTILVGAASWGDPALVLTRRLAAAHPHVRILSVLCPEDGGLNPKVSTLRTLSVHARTDLVLISDSNVRVSPGYVRRTLESLRDPRVRLVTNPIVGTGEVSLGSWFEGLHLTTYVARALAFAAQYLGRACVVGKSMLFRLSDLERVGGWDGVRNVLAEDYAIGHAFEQAGLRVVTSPEVIFNYNRAWTVDRFANRHLRWGQMRRRTCLPAYLLEPLFNPTPILLAAALVSLVSRQHVAVVLPACMALIGARLVADWCLLARMRTGPLPLSKVFLTLPKDVLVVGLWAVALFRRSLTWRGNRLIINAGTVLTAAEPDATHGAWASRRSPATVLHAPPS